MLVLNEWEYEALAMSATRKSKPRSQVGGNMKLNRDGDISMIAPLTKHARQRAKERNISLKDAVTKYAVTTSNSNSSVIATVFKNNTKNQDDTKFMPPDLLPSGHVIQTIEAPKASIGRIIGAKGKTVGRLRSTHTVDISVVAGKSYTVYIWGPMAGVNKASKEIESIITREEEAESKRSQRSTARQAPEPADLKKFESIESVNVPTSIAGLVFGKGKGKLMSIAVKNNVRYEVREGSKNPKVVFWGKSTDVATTVGDLHNTIFKKKLQLGKKSENKTKVGNRPKEDTQKKYAKQKRGQSKLKANGGGLKEGIQKESDKDRSIEKRIEPRIRRQTVPHLQDCSVLPFSIVSMEELSLIGDPKRLHPP